MSIEASAVARLHKAAVQYRQNFESLWSDVYLYCMPARPGFSVTSPGQNLNITVSDDTAIQAADDFVSLMIDGVVPPFSAFFSLEPGPAVDPGERDDLKEQLDQVTEYMHDLLPTSNFTTEVQDTFLDLVVGTGALIMREHPVYDFEFEAVPLNRLYALWGAGKLRVVIRQHDMTIADIRETWPDADLPTWLSNFQNVSEKKFAVFEGWFRRRTPFVEQWDAVVYMNGSTPGGNNTDILKQSLLEGIGAMPVIMPRMRTSSGEGYGRGPGVSSIASVRVINEVIDMLMEQADLHGSGVWTADDDGTVNFDTVVIDPGMVWPRMPGTRGLEQVRLGGDFNLSQFVLGDYRANIRRAFYVDDVSPGRPDAKTPSTAEEVRAMRQRLSSRIGAPFVRLVREFVVPLVQRYAWILRQRGRIELPAIDGRTVRVETAAPFATVKSEAEAGRLLQYPAAIAQAFGPQTALMEINPERFVREIADLLGVPRRLARTMLEKQQLQQQLADAAQAAQDQGIDPAALTNNL